MEHGAQQKAGTQHCEFKLRKNKQCAECLIPLLPAFIISPHVILHGAHLAHPLLERGLVGEELKRRYGGAGPALGVIV